jgi:hypothetical protein
MVAGAIGQNAQVVWIARDDRIATPDASHDDMRVDHIARGYVCHETHDVSCDRAREVVRGAPGEQPRDVRLSVTGAPRLREHPSRDDRRNSTLEWPPVQRPQPPVVPFCGEQGTCVVSKARPTGRRRHVGR